jgi:hypothetical protein
MISAAEIAKGLGARRSGPHQWQGCCPSHKDRTPSLSITDGDDGRPLVHCFAGCKQDEVIEALRRKGLWGDDSRSGVNRMLRTAETIDCGTIILPIPDCAPPPPKAHPKFGEPTGTWEYVRDGSPQFYVWRFDGPEGKKEIRPLTYWTTGWHFLGIPEPRPLYGLDKLAENPSAPVVVVEGEKAADAASRIFPDSICVTSPGGSKAATKADWTPLAKRQILLWPDADEAGAGYQQAVTTILQDLDCAISVVEFDGKPESWDAADAVAEWPDLAALRCEVLQHAKPYEEPNDTKRAGLRNFTFLGDDTPAPQKMLIEGVMPLEGLPFIGGQSSAGKTFVAILIAACAASGKTLFGHTVNERVGSVIVAAEGKAMLRARIAAAMKELGIEENAPIAWVKQVPDFNRSEGQQAFIQELRALDNHFRDQFGVRLGLVFVDTVSASFDIKEEADNAEAARVCKVMRRIGDAISALVVPIHHYGKNAAVGLRGASAWRANADFVLSVMADIDPQTGNVTNRQLAVAKDRDGAQGALTPFTLKPVELGLDDSGRPWGSMVAVAAEGTAKPASDWPQALGVFRQALQTTLATDAHEARPFPDGPEVRVTFLNLVRDEFAKITHVDSDTEAGRKEALRKQFTRKLTDAQNKKLVGVRTRDDGKSLIWLVSREAAQ